MPNYLYILSRNDMASMGFGKAIAQGAHVANDFMMREFHIPWTKKSVNPTVVEWIAEAETYGTTITLSANMRELDEIVKTCNENGIIARLVVDPEYHIQDGDTWHIVPNVVTGAYVFGDKEKLKPFLSRLDLVPNTYISND